MAFRPPQRIQTSRQFSFPVPASEDPQSAASQAPRNLEDSQEWVVFSPLSPSAASETASTGQTATNLSHFTELGSVNNSDQIQSENGLSENITENGEDDPDADAELDSLDDGLHAFHEPSDLGSPRARMIRSNESVPAQEVMGTYGQSSAIQDSLRQFERYSPRKKPRPSSNQQPQQQLHNNNFNNQQQQRLDALREEEEILENNDRIMRIEAWRLEQSRALLEEIEREAKRMRQMNRVASVHSLAQSANIQTKSEYHFSESGISTPMLYNEPLISSFPEEDVEESESWWKRLTRRVIRDLIGIDDETLSVIFGESLPASPIEQESLPAAQNPTWSSSTWQERLLERLAKELGILVHQLSEHPGAFTTYLRTQEPIPYVGLTSHATTENASGPSDSQNITSPLLPSPFLPSTTTTTAAAAATNSFDASHLLSSNFPPTMYRQITPPNTDLSLWGIEETPELNYTESENLQREKEYWEQDLDVRMVFNFLKSRFSSSSTPIPEPSFKSSLSNNSLHRKSTLSTTTPLSTVDNNDHNDNSNSRYNNNKATITIPTTPTSANSRAALIRLHHPLAAASAIRKRDRAFNAGIQRRSAHAHAHMRTHSVGGGTSSCASQSTKRSVRSVGSAARPTGHFWEVPSSSAGGVSASVSGWGEVGGST